MANKYRNEMMIKIGEVEILLRPTFQNCANLEAALGYGIPMLAFNLMNKKLPGLADMVQVIFFCQADKKLTLEEIWDLVMVEGIGSSTQVLQFIGQITTGDKTQVAVSESELKKNQ
jgi:hypothetical protein